MALLFTILNGIFSSVFSATACGGANLAFSMLTDHGGKERKRHDLALEKLQRARDKRNEDRMKRLDFINKRYAKKMSREHTSTMLMRQYVSTIEHLKKKRNFYHRCLNYLIFTIHQRPKKIANYYLLQLVQELQHMP